MSSKRTRNRPSRVFRPRLAHADYAAGKTRGLTTFFCSFIALMLILFIALPKADFSDTERRQLQAAPKLTSRALLDGSYEDRAEEYVSDHFPMRLFFVGLSSYTKLALGQTLINEVYVGNNSWFMQQPVALGADNLEQNMQAVCTLQEKLGIPAYVIAVPSTGYIMSDELPTVHLPYEDEQIRAAACEVLGDHAVWIDTVQALRQESRSEQVYYRTDHHWTTPGAYQAYLTWAEQRGFAAPPRSSFSIDSYGGFLGTTYAKVLLWDVPPDTIELWQYPNEIEVITQDGDTGMEPIKMESFYDMGRLDTYDPYAVFFGGNHSVVRITNPSADAQRRLLMFKDSYANCLAPFLARHYSEIVMIDPRYFRTFAEFLEDEEPFDELMFVYGIGQLVQDEDLGRIAA